MFSIDLGRRLRFFDNAHVQNDGLPVHHNPVQTVFNTAELLELILLELDMKTLLLSQATNHTFSSTITTSPRLRQKLWLDPAPQSPHLTTQTPTNEPTLNPLLQSIITKGLHPHIRFLELEYSSLDFYPALSRRLMPSEPPTVCLALAPKARVAKWSGSWRRMLVVQPYDLTTRWDAYHYRWATRDWDFMFTGTFDDEDGGDGLGEGRGRPPSLGRVVRFALGPGFEGKDGDGV